MSGTAGGHPSSRHPSQGALYPVSIPCCFQFGRHPRVSATSEGAMVKKGGQKIHTRLAGCGDGSQVRPRCPFLPASLRERDFSCSFGLSGMRAGSATVQIMWPRRDPPVVARSIFHSTKERQTTLTTKALRPMHKMKRDLPPHSNDHDLLSSRLFFRPLQRVIFTRPSQFRRRRRPMCP